MELLLLMLSLLCRRYRHLNCPARHLLLLLLLLLMLARLFRHQSHSAATAALAKKQALSLLPHDGGGDDGEVVVRLVSYEQAQS